MPGCHQIAYALIGIAIASCARQIPEVQSVEESRDRAYSIYVFDFELNSYYQISTSNIEGAATCHLVLESNSRPARVISRALAKLERGKFDEGWVRMKIIMPDDFVVFVDLNGGVLALPANREARLDEEAFADLQALIEHDEAFESCLRR